MNLTVQFQQIHCNKCQGIFAVPTSVHKTWEETHKDWYCPYCKCGWHFDAESDAEKYRSLYEQKDRCCDNLRELVGLRDRQIRGSKGAMGLIRKQRDEARQRVDAETEGE